MNENHLRWAMSKPFQVLQLTKATINVAVKMLPENHFVFYGLDSDNIKCYDDDCSVYPKVGGFFYIKGQKTKKIYDGDYIVMRKDFYDILDKTYFENNYVAI
jgi:hypothetical protein